ncbi:MAG TPA: FtsX-like permease family protein, partial [Thermoanaerobaculia bacterium]|nr:FtsX-like permease family protein [Thermoanaerobaculia bacterium]
ARGFGLGPAWRGGAAAAASLRPGARVTPGRGPRQRSDLLVAGQIGFSLLLLTGAGLLLRSLLALGAVDLGFRPAGAVSIGLRLAPGENGSPERMVAFYDALFPRLAALPGVRALGAADQLPLQGLPETTDIRVEGLADPSSGEELMAHPLTVTPGYLAAMGTPLRRGRDLAASDRAGGQPVALVSEGLARQLWPGQQPLGKRLALSFEALRFRADGPPTLDFASAYRTVVGVVADVRQEGPDVAALPAIYVPFAQRPSAEMTLVLRSALAPAALARDVATVVHELDRAQPLGDVVPLPVMVADNVGTPRARALLTSLFAVLTLLLACVGLYGVLAHAVAAQRQELGVRLALGAARRQILGLVGKRAGRMLLAGAAAGVLGSLLVRQALAPFLFRLAPTDPVALLLALVALAAAATGAALLPAWRATRVDPAIVLRGE